MRWCRPGPDGRWWQRLVRWGERVSESQAVGRAVVCGLRCEGRWREGERARCDELDDAAVVFGKMRRNGGG